MESFDMKKHLCLAGAGHGIHLLSAGAELLTAGMLVATACLSAGQTQLQPSQQPPDSFVAVVAAAQGLPSVSAENQAPVGTYWEVRNSLPCLTAPLPFPPRDSNTVVYAIGGGQFLVDESSGPLVPPLAAPYARTTLSTADYAAILQAQVGELQNFVARIQAAQLTAQMSASSLDSPPMPGGGGGGSGGGTNYSSPTYTTNDLWLEMTNVAAGLEYLNLHNATNQVYAIWGATNLPADWTVEAEVWPTNTAVMAFTVPALAGQSLFVRAEDWTSVDSDGDGIPDWWIWQYYGNLNESATNLDSQGNTLLYDYQNGLDPNVIQFTLSVPNNYVNTSTPQVQVSVLAGAPSAIAVSVDDTNYAADALWQPYTGTPLTVSLGATEGWHQVWVGLKGRAPNATVTWQWKRLKLEVTPPLIVLTQPTNAVVTRPVIQVRGYSPEALSGLSYDLTNALGLVTNQPVWVLDQFYNTNTWEFTTNTFQAFDVPLTNGPNTFTIHASDLAGNAATASFTFTLDYSSKTNPPEVALYWPQDQTPLGNGPYTWRGWISDPTASVMAQLVDTNGDTNVFEGLVERDGHFWVENLPLLAGPNYLTLVVTDVVGNVAMTNITVFPGAVALTITAPTPDQLWQQGITVNGTISDATDYTVWVNGVAATVNGDGTWTASPVNLPQGGTAVIQARAIPDSDNGGHGAGGGSGGGTVSYDNLGNPTSAGAIDAEAQSDKPSRLFVQSYNMCENTAYNSWYYEYNPPGIFFQSGTVSGYDYCWDVNWWDGQGGLGSQSEQDTWTVQYPGGSGSTNNVAWVSQQTWPASWWPMLLNGTQTASGDYDWPNFQTNIGPANVIQEQCVIQLPCVKSWSGRHNADSTLFENGAYQGNYTRSGQGAKMMLQTGGKGLSPQENLWQLSSFATQYCPTDAGVTMPDVQFLSQPVASTNIQILGKALGSDGNMWTTLPNNAEVDVTPKVPGVDYFGFNVSTQEYHPYITLSTATTPSPDLDTATPEVCVGQQVTFTLNGLPPYQEQVGHWTLPQTYVNEPWQLTSWVVTDPITGAGYWDPYGSVNYRINPI